MIYLKLGPSDRVKINCLMCQVLLWSRGKSLYEVRKFLGRANPEKFEEIKEERKDSLLDEKIDIFSKVLLIFPRVFFNLVIDQLILLLKMLSQIERLGGEGGDFLRAIKECPSHDSKCKIIWHGTPHCLRLTQLNSEPNRKAETDHRLTFSPIMDW